MESYIVIDAYSAKLPEEEIKQIQILEEMIKIQTRLVEQPYHIKVWAAIIAKIRWLRRPNTKIVMYLTKISQFWNNGWDIIKTCFQDENILVLVGQQALFYFLGKVSMNTACVWMLSKEKMFFSLDFIETAKEF